MARGRPREFDPDIVLDKALDVFRRDGFEPTSVQSLADAMGICKPSLYAAYGNKEGLFLAVVERYGARTQHRRAALLDSAADARGGVHALLTDVIENDAECHAQGGCLLVTESAGGAAAAHSERVRTALSLAMSAGREVLVARLLRAQSDGELAPDVDVHALADYFGTVMTGLSIASRGGTTIDTQRSVVATAMRAWPSAASQSIRSGSRTRSTTTPSTTLTK